MADELTIINRIIEEHQNIRSYVKLVGDSMTDREALSSLSKTRADWVPGRPEILTEKQKRLEQTTSALKEGLEHHFGYEETYLPPILGELFMRALLIDHREIRKAIDQTRTRIINLEAAGLSREECLVKESEIQYVIDNLSQTIEEHTSREEIVLEMLQRALQEKQQTKDQT